MANFRIQKTERRKFQFLENEKISPGLKTPIFEVPKNATKTPERNAYHDYHWEGAGGGFHGSRISKTG